MTNAETDNTPLPSTTPSSSMPLEGRPQERSELLIVVAVTDDEASWAAAQFAERIAGDDDTVLLLNVASPAEPIQRKAGELRSLSWLAYGALVIMPPVAPVMATNPPEDEGHIEADDVRLPKSAEDDDMVITVGDPVERICSLADQVNADLVVVGTGDRGAWSRIFSGHSVSRGVVDHAPCSVLVVR